MNLYYKMLRMKARRRARKMRGGLGGLLGETWQGYVNKAGEDANKGAARFQRGMSEAEKIRKENVDQFTAARKAGLKAGAPPKQDTHSDLARLAMKKLSIANQGRLPYQVAAQYRDAEEGSQRTTNENPLSSSPVHTGHAPRTGRHAPRQIVYTGGKRKTKKRRRRRKKKKTKRKKKRRKRKTKRRKSRKKSRKKRGGIDDLCKRYYVELQNNRVGSPSKMMDAHNYCRAYGGENMAACRIDDLNNLPGGECIKSSGEMKEEDIAARKKEAKEYLKRRWQRSFR